VTVQANGSWKLKVRPLALGSNKIQLRALSATGVASAIKKLKVVRL
jgi:hypothetical protein